LQFIRQGAGVLVIQQRVRWRWMETPFAIVPADCRISTGTSARLLSGKGVLAQTGHWAAARTVPARERHTRVYYFGAPGTSGHGDRPLTSALKVPLRWAQSHEGLLGVLVTTVFINTGQGSMAPVLPLYAESLGVSLALVGLVVGGFGFGRLVMNIPAGLLADRFGQRVVICTGPAVVAVATLLMGFSTEYWHLLTLRFVQGMGGGMFMTIATAYASTIAGPERRARYASYQQSAQSLGAGIGPVLGGTIAQAFGLRAPFFVVGGLAVIAFVWALFRVREPKPSPAPTPKANVGGTSSTLRRFAVIDLLATPTYIAACFFTAAMFGNSSSGRNNLVPLHMDSLGFTPSQIGSVLTLAVAAQFMAIAFFGGLSDRTGRRLVVLPCALVLGAGMIAFVLSRNYWALAAAMFVMQAAEGLAAPVPVAFVADVSKRFGRPGLAFGVYRTFGDAGLVVIPVMFGFVADRFGITWGLVGPAALFVAASVLVFLVAKEPPRQARLHRAT
jgi:MFS family permease